MILKVTYTSTGVPIDRQIPDFEQFDRNVDFILKWISTEENCNKSDTKAYINNKYSQKSVSDCSEMLNNKIQSIATRHIFCIQVPIAADK